jgi:CDP-diacylglycerol--glycerol-3-phosphate 3-phosphatidyltransferase
MEQHNSTEPAVAQKPTLTDRLRVIVAPVIDPIVTFLARYQTSPDFLTVIGTLAHFIVAWLLATGQFRWAGVALIILAPLDALDGALSRKLGRKPNGYGAYLDSTLDRLAEIIMFGGFLYYYLMQDNPQMVFVTYLAVTGSVMVSYARARAESLDYNSKVGLGSRVERYVLLIVLLLLNMPNIALIVLAVLSYVTLAQRMYHVWHQEYGRGNR